MAATPAASSEVGTMDNSVSFRLVQPPAVAPKRAETLPTRSPANVTLADPQQAVTAAPKAAETRLHSDPAMHAYAMMLAQDIRRRLPRKLRAEAEGTASQGDCPSAAAALKLRAYAESAERSEEITRSLIGLSRDV